MTRFSVQPLNDSVWKGLEVRVPDSSLEPLLLAGTLVIVASSAVKPVCGDAVLVELVVKGSAH